MHNTLAYYAFYYAGIFDAGLAVINQIWFLLFYNFHAIKNNLDTFVILFAGKHCSVKWDSSAAVFLLRGARPLWGEDETSIKHEAFAPPLYIYVPLSPQGLITVLYTIQATAWFNIQELKSRNLEFLHNITVLA